MDILTAYREEAIALCLERGDGKPGQAQRRGKNVEVMGMLGKSILFSMSNQVL